MADVTDRDALVAELWRQVRPRQLELSEELVDRLETLAADPSDTAAWAVVRSHAHRLAGTLGSYGQAAAGRAAVELEYLVAGRELPLAAGELERARELAATVRCELTAT